MLIESKAGSFAKTPNAKIELGGVRKERVIKVGEFELSIKHPAEANVPNDIERLLTGITRKLEEWALSTCSAKQS